MSNETSSESVYSYIDKAIDELRQAIDGLVVGNLNAEAHLITARERISRLARGRNDSN